MGATGQYCYIYDEKGFQSTRPRWARRRHGASIYQADCNFNPRARDGRDLAAKMSPSSRMNFNPRARDGRDSSAFCLTKWRRYFNPRARDGRDHACPLLCDCRRDFNPRARDGRDARRSRIGARVTISIHAPAMGATISAHQRYLRQHISIHAPAMGATGVHPVSRHRGINFNPRARDGRDCPFSPCLTTGT